ncbi:hypothetical protein CH299_28595 [Rhodococcus sp. 14-2686-1-2]|nr:hypothetical protein CH301_28075 [Rhodococcus sp. 15-1189-1-1a]OZF08130.1 hypothetical protein CH299_28595 [Rhodococcus sp. 14-2686-1-2]
MWRRILLTIAVAVIAAVGFAWPAAAQPEAVPAPVPGGGSTATTTAKKLPETFPADLRKYIAGTDEFKAAPWFTGPCKDKGGDMGQYVGSVMSNEGRLLYWTATENDRIARWTAAVSVRKDPVLIGVLIDAGAVGSQTTGVDLGVEQNRKAALSITDDAVLESFYPPVYPAGDAAMQPPAPTCAQDLARWTTKTSSTWGFEWASTPDAASLAEMKAQPNADQVPEQAWTDACADGVPGSLCMHAMYVNCSKATDRDDEMTCREWNTRIGKLFGGTMNWIDQNTSFSDRLSETLESAFKATPQYKVGKMYVDGFSWVWDNSIGAVSDIVDFVKDPSDVIDSWANKLKSSAIAITTSVLHGLAGIGEFDPGQPEFVAVYAMSTGLGILVLVLMTMLAIHKSSDGSRPGTELAKDLFGYAPAGIMMMLFAPSMAQLIISLAHELSVSLIAVLGTTTDEVIDNVSSVLGPLTDATLVGGAIAAIAGFLLLFLGALAMFFGFLMHAAALPVLAVVCGIAFGMWVHPTWRKKALRPVMMFLGIVLSKPLMFVILAAIFSVINVAAAGAVADDGELESLGDLGLIAVCFVMIGLAPFALLKYSPILPTSADSADFGSSGSATGQAIGSSAGMYQQRAGGGSSVASKNAGAAGAPGRDSGGASGSDGSHGSGGTGSGRGSSASSTHAGHQGGQTASRSGGISSGRGGGGGHGGAKAGGSESKLLAAAGKTAGAAAGAATVVAPIALSAAGAAMNKAGSAAQSAPEHADSDN